MQAIGPSYQHQLFFAVLHAVKLAFTGITFKATKDIRPLLFVSFVRAMTPSFPAFLNLSFTSALFASDFVRFSDSALPGWSLLEPRRS